MKNTDQNIFIIFKNDMKNMALSRKSCNYKRKTNLNHVLKMVTYVVR